MNVTAFSVGSGMTEIVHRVYKIAGLSDVPNDGMVACRKRLFRVHLLASDSAGRPDSAA